MDQGSRLMDMSIKYYYHQLIRRLLPSSLTNNPPHRQYHKMAPSRGMTLLRPLLRPPPVDTQYRAFSASAVQLSGHNRWSKIKHDKGKADAYKNRQRSIFAQEIATASKLFGPDVNANPKLADLVIKAKKEGFAKASIEAAIARGQGRSLTGVSLERLTVEGILPNNVAVIVECETDNKLRTLANIKLVIKDNGGTATPSSYLFEKKGRIVFDQKDGVGLGEVMDPALEAGATDVDELEDGSVVVFTAPEETKTVGEAVSAALGTQIKTSDIIWDPNGDTKTVIPSEDAAEDLADFVDIMMEEESTVHAISMNVAQGAVSAESWKALQTRLS
jgi:YebC/PmpR family DNA-binding regulatory protein